MFATKLMMDELALVASASHHIWGTVDDVEPPPPPPVPQMTATIIKRVHPEADFVAFSPDPTNSQADIDQVAIYPGPQSTVYEIDGPFPLDEDEASTELLTWSESLLRWEFQHTDS